MSRLDKILLLLLIALYFFFRLTNLLLPPIFTDESCLVEWAQEIWFHRDHIPDSQRDRKEFPSPYQPDKGNGAVP